MSIGEELGLSLLISYAFIVSIHPVTFKRNPPGKREILSCETLFPLQKRRCRDASWDFLSPCVQNQPLLVCRADGHATSAFLPG
jgi:hypothetical protein